MQRVPKFKVQVLFVDSAMNVTLWIHDTSITNVLRKVADLQFTENGLQEPLEIIIGPRYD